MNIHDLARHLNVSIGTVSRALNGRRDVSAETRERVLAAAERLGYSANQSGRSLRQGATGMIGFMMATNRERAAKGEAFFMAVLDGLQPTLAARGLDLMVLLSSIDQDPFDYMRRVVERRLADGMIIADTQRIDPRIDYLIKRKLPFVAFGRSLSAATTPGSTSTSMASPSNPSNGSSALVIGGSPLPRRRTKSTTAISLSNAVGQHSPAAG